MVVDTLVCKQKHARTHANVYVKTPHLLEVNTLCLHSLALVVQPACRPIQVLSHCERITDAGIRHIVNSACSGELQVLELDNCPLITDDALEMLR